MESRPGSTPSLRKLSPYRPLLLSSFTLAACAAVFLARWVYLHFDDPTIDAPLGVASDWIPIAIAVVGIVMSYRSPKKEHHLVVTVTLFLVGLGGTGILSWNRVRNDSAHKKEVADLNQKITSVGIQNGQILTKLLTNGDSLEPRTATSIEAARRENVLTALRSDYILSENSALDKA